MFRILAVGLLFIFASGPQAIGQEQETTNDGATIAQEDFAEHAAIYETFLLNARSWKQGDFAVLVTDRCDTAGRKHTKDCIFETTTEYRIRFDHTQDRFLCARQSKTEYLQLEHDELELASLNNNSIIESGFRISESGVYVVERPKRFGRAYGKKTLEELNASFRVPEFRSIGLLVGGRRGTMEHIENLVPMLASGKGVVNANHTQTGNLHFVRHTSLENNPGQFFVTEIEFDTELKMPIAKKVGMSVLLPDGKRKVMPQFTESIQWKEISGTLVPTSVKIEGRDNRTIGGNRYRFNKITDMEFKWMSFNKEISKDQFDASLLDDFEGLMVFDSK